jgi:hypothetical protein
MNFFLSHIGQFLNNQFSSESSAFINKIKNDISFRNRINFFGEKKIYLKKL